MNKNKPTVDELCDTVLCSKYCSASTSLRRKECRKQDRVGCQLLGKWITGKHIVAMVRDILRIYCTKRK